MAREHPLLEPAVVAEVERAATGHLGHRWTSQGFTSLDDRASHPCGILHGEPFSIFAKLGAAPDAREQFSAELAGLALLSRLGRVATPVPVGDGLAGGPGGALLLSEALPECPPHASGPRHWRSIGHALAALHQVTGTRFGLGEQRGFFGPLPQDNRPVPANRWADFYAERRLIPMLRLTLLHGDAQQNNFVTTEAGAVLIDAAPYFGHPEADLALVGYFQPVPAALFAAYDDVLGIDPGFAARRELWRLPAYLAVIAVDGHSPLGRQFTTRLATAIATYQ